MVQTEGCETSISGCFVLFLSQCPKLLIDLMYVHNTFYVYIVAVVAAHKPPMQFQLMLQNDLYCPQPNYSENNEVVTLCSATVLPKQNLVLLFFIEHTFVWKVWLSI